MKNRISSILLCMAMVISMLPQTVLFASAATSGIYAYTVTDGKATITDCSSSASGAITIPETLGGYPVTSIGDDAFAYCSNLTSVVIPEGVTSIGNSAFYYCSSLASITIPDSVTSIGDKAFCECYYLESIVIPDSVKTIDDWAFYNCGSLGSVTIGKGVTSIGVEAFCGCERLTGITVDEKNANYCDIDGNLFTKDKKTLIQYAIGKQASEYIIPDSVTSIMWYAFFYCKSLTSVTIPASVTSIGEYAFYGCNSLTIRGYAESYARIYAEENKIPFEEIAAIPDINGDGETDTGDVTTLRRYLAGGYEDVITVVKKALDVNGDGKVNTRDVAALRNLIAG